MKQSFLWKSIIFVCFAFVFLCITKGISPTAYEIYRKTGDSSYPKIKTIKTSKYAFKYVDKNVKKGTTYTYKFRTYTVINNKKCYSKFSSTVKLAAVNKTGKFQLTSMPNTSGKVNELVIGLTSKQGNGTTKFIDSFGDICYTLIKTKKSDTQYTILVATQYSYNGIDWFDFPDKGVSISEGETIYIKLKSEDNKAFSFYPTDVVTSKLEWNLTYNKRHTILEIDFTEKSVSTRINGEFYH